MRQGRQYDQQKDKVVIVNGGKSSGQISRNEPSSPPTLTEEGIGHKPRKQVTKQGGPIEMKESLDNQTTVKLNELSFESE
jgi:hypothetical protein